MALAEILFLFVEKYFISVVAALPRLFLFCKSFSFLVSNFGGISVSKNFYLKTTGTAALSKKKVRIL